MPIVTKLGLRGLGLCGVALVCGSCAKFPSGGGFGNFTSITFSFRVRGSIRTPTDVDPTYYIYDVAIAASPDPNPLPKSAPIPTVDSSNPNGRMNGSPTHFVEFNSQDPLSPQPFTLYRFALNSEIRDTYDAGNPTNLAFYTRSQRGFITNYTIPQNGGDPAVLTFTITANLLADTDAEARLLRSLQVNILTMTQPSNFTGARRVIDGLGDSSTLQGLVNFAQIDLLKAGTTNNTITMLEPAEEDTYGGTEPDVDIIDYSITVSPVAG